MSRRLHWLEPDSRADLFPPVSEALDDPDGLLAAGGDLSVARLLCAYERGIFPWYEQGQPVLWWAPDPRTVIRSADFHTSRSLARAIKRQDFRVSFNQRFDKVISACAGSRRGQSGTWITEDMMQSYTRLFDLGYAFSAECWLDDRLVGGLYGIAMDRMVFGESMYSEVPNASKVVLMTLCRVMNQLRWPLLDCQVDSAHLRSLGATTLPRDTFSKELALRCTNRRASASQLPSDLIKPLNYL